VQDNGAVFQAGDTCSVDVEFYPVAAGTRLGAVVLQDAAQNAIAFGYVSGTGVGALVAFLPVTRSVVANGLAGPSGIAVDALGNFFSPRGQRLRVLLEVGAPGGRCGVRSDEQLKTVLGALERWKGAILLSGVELYEGILDNETEVRAFLQRAVDITEHLIATNRFEHKPPLLSGAGSTWFDVVADVFTAAVFSEPVEIVLRPGCYLTHDAGFYREAHAKVLLRNSVARQIYEGLEPALQVWAYVQSIPEETRAIVGIGKRDASFDLGLPFPALHFRPGRQMPAPAPKHWALSKMMDQHAYLEIAAGDGIRVGDMIGFDISHPCLTFDRWRVIPIVNSKYKVVDLVQTYF